MEDMDPPDPSVQVVRSLLACAGCFVPSSAFATSTADWQSEPQPAGQGSAGATAPLGPRSGATAPATVVGTADDGPTALSIVPSSDAAFHDGTGRSAAAPRARGARRITHPRNPPGCLGVTPPSSPARLGPPALAPSGVPSPTPFLAALLLLHLPAAAALAAAPLPLHPRYPPPLSSLPSPTAPFTFPAPTEAAPLRPTGATFVQCSDASLLNAEAAATRPQPGGALASSPATLSSGLALPDRSTPPGGAPEPPADRRLDGLFVQCSDASLLNGEAAETPSPAGETTGAAPAASSLAAVSRGRAASSGDAQQPSADGRLDGLFVQCSSGAEESLPPSPSSQLPSSPPPSTFGRPPQWTPPKA